MNHGICQDFLGEKHLYIICIQIQQTQDLELCRNKQKQYIEHHWTVPSWLSRTMLTFYMVYAKWVEQTPRSTLRQIWQTTPLWREIYRFQSQKWHFSVKIAWKPSVSLVFLENPFLHISSRFFFGFRVAPILGRAIQDDEAFERVNQRGYVAMACGRSIFQWQQLDQSSLNMDSCKLATRCQSATSDLWWITVYCPTCRSSWSLGVMATEQALNQYLEVPQIHKERVGKKSSAPFFWGVSSAFLYFI